MVGDFVFVVVERAAVAMATDNFHRGIHHLLDRGGRGDRFALEEFGRNAGVPHRAMGGTVCRLVLRGEQLFDLIVGRVDRPSAAGFVVALAAELQRRLGERGAVVVVRRGARAELGGHHGSS